MNPKDALLKIRALFEDMPQEPVVAAAPTEVPAPAETKVQMAEYSLVDGTKVMISALEIGGKVEMADGTPAPMGEHQLADGTSIQLDEAGIIIEISSPKEDVIVEEPVAPAAPVEPAQDVTAMVAEVENKFNAQKEQLEKNTRPKKKVNTLIICTNLLVENFVICAGLFSRITLLKMT